MEIKKVNTAKKEEEQEREREIEAKRMASQGKIKKPKPGTEVKKGIPKTRLIFYLSTLAVLILASAAYNFFQYRSATQPHPPEKEIQAEDKSYEFYELCSDIEIYRDEFGEYPTFIKDLVYSDNLDYTRRQDDSFVLKYHDEHIDLSYDSKKDRSKIE
ncbi:MAG: hypothetical protein JXB23_18000 [Candidatus Aminicenantes bacterium]|nr:hypothetical protein [Candidatus Aminicenantes bacterium]